MSYTKFPISPEQSVGLKFGYNSYKSINLDPNRRLWFDEDGNVTSVGVAAIVHSGYVNNCVNKKVAATLGVDDFEKAVDTLSETDEGKEILQAVVKVWEESDEMKAAAERAKAVTIETDEEKKSTLTE